MKPAQFGRWKPKYPFGTVAGLLTGSVATLIGVATGIEPFTILCRAGVSGLLTGLVIGIGVNVIRIANVPNEQQRSQ